MFIVESPSTFENTLGEKLTMVELNILTILENFTQSIEYLKL